IITDQYDINPSSQPLESGATVFVFTPVVASSHTIKAESSSLPLATSVYYTPTDIPVWWDNPVKLHLLAEGQNLDPGKPDYDTDPVTGGRENSPAPLTAGVTTQITVNLVDEFYNVVKGVTPFMAVSSNTPIVELQFPSDPNIQLRGLAPDPFLKALENGTTTFIFVPVSRSPGGMSLRIIDNHATGTNFSADTVSGIVVNSTNAVALQLLVKDEVPDEGSIAGKTGASGPLIAGTAYTIKARSVDKYWNLAPIGRNVVLTSNDIYAVHPISQPLAAGEATINGFLPSAATNNLVINAVDDGSVPPLLTQTDSGIKVEPGAAQKMIVVLPGQYLVPGKITQPYGVGGAISTTIAGNAFDAMVYAADSRYNKVSGVNKSNIKATSDDPFTPSIGFYSMTDGSATISGITLRTAGNRILTIDDLSGVSPILSQNQNGVLPLSPNSPTKLRVLLSGESREPGSTGNGRTGTPDNWDIEVSTTVTVDITDSFWNLTPGASQEIRLIADDLSTIVSPLNQIVVSSAIFTVTPKKVGDLQLTAEMVNSVPSWGPVLAQDNASTINVANSPDSAITAGNLSFNPSPLGAGASADLISPLSIAFDIEFSVSSNYIGGVISGSVTIVSGNIQNSDGFYTISLTSGEGQFNNVSVTEGANGDGFVHIDSMTFNGLAGLIKNTTNFDLVSPINPSGQTIAGINLTVSYTPFAPTGFSGAALSNESIKWSWIDNAANEDGYRIKNSADEIIADLSSDTTEYIETGLETNTSYYRFVQVYNANGDTGADAVDFTLANPPTGSFVVEQSFVSIKMQWSANSNPAYTGWGILKSTDNFAASSITLKNFGSDYTSLVYTDMGLSPNTTYWYKVQAFNADGIETAFDAVVSTMTAPIFVSTGIISGKITEADGITPIPGANIEILRSDNKNLITQALTDISGNYSVTITTGTYDIVISLEGYDSQTMAKVLVVSNQSSAVDFAINETASPGQPDLIIESMTISTTSPRMYEIITATIIVKNQGDASAGAFYLDFYKNLNSSPTVKQVGDKCWQVPSLAALASSTFTYSFAYPGGEMNPYAQIDTEGSILEAGENNNIYGPINLKEPIQTGILSGKIFVQGTTVPVKGASIVAKQGGEEVASVLSAVDGSYKLSLLAGNYTIEVSAPGFDMVAHDVLINQGVTITDDEPSLSPTAGIIYGKVTKIDGVTPLPDATVNVSGGAFITTTTYLGDYKAIVNPGSYNVNVSLDGYDEQTEPVSVSAAGSSPLDFQLIFDIIPPEPISDLIITALDDTKIRLDWTKSVTAEVESYNIYYASGALDMSKLFSSVKAVVSNTQASWTSDYLPRGERYYFSVRPVANIEAQDIEDNAINNVVSAIVVEQVHGAKARIKIPQTGKKVSGNRVLIMADVYQNPDFTSKVLFEYKPSFLDTWETIIPAVTEHPNPDTIFPYFTHWDVTSLDNGNYDIRAVAYDSYGAEDNSPEYATVSINRVDKDIEENVVDGVHIREEKIDNRKDNISRVAAEESDITEVKVPAGSLENTTDYVRIKVNPPLFAQTPLGGFAQFIMTRGVSLGSGQKKFGKYIEISLPYEDEDNNGVVDGTNIKEDNIEIWSCDEETEDWSKERNIRIDKINKKAKVKVKHLSIFSIVLLDAGDFSALKVYPSPVKVKQGHDRLKFVGLTSKDVTIKIFNIAGELVFKQKNINTATYEWYLKNDDGQTAVSGIYIYIITDNADNETKGKFGLIR
ncbi:MAG: carboxypeptidase regulatory-like domain-containing protein, partial [Elusimicrobia bacterium]|nr:carboxypeptidase regulatory-like domain-containing protein [Elusimicrobiota bacterium]